MNINFVTMCGIIVCVALITTAIIGPLLWDAAGYVENILNNVYHVEFSVVEP